MLLITGQLRGGRETGSLTTPAFEIRWHGLVYSQGTTAGVPAVEKFARAAETDLASAAAELKGIFFIALLRRCSGECYAFVDNSALYHAYHSPRFAGTSFVEIARLEEMRPQDFDPESLVEFLHFGAIAFGRTLSPQIRKIDADVIVKVHAAGTTELIHKPIPDIGVAAPQPLEDFLRDFASSVAGRKISLDLTGGIDSRLLAVLLSYYGLPLELAASGVPGNSDLRIAEQVARTLRRDFVPTYHDPAIADWEQILEICDGLFDPGKAHRPFQLQQDRQRRGVELALSGAGGELFKDFWWLQDFPLYRRHSPSLDRLYALRIAATQPEHSYLAGAYSVVSRGLRKETLRRLEQYVAETNTETYDRVYYYYKMREVAGRFLTNSLHLLEVYAPYLELDAVRAGHGLSRWRRFFNHYHRDLITRFHAGAAGIPTTEGGMTASSRPSDVTADLTKYVADRCKRLARKAGQKVLHRNLGQESADHPGLNARLRELVIARRSVQRLQEQGILSSSAAAQTMESRYLGPLLAIDWLSEQLEQPSTFKDSQESGSVAA